MQITGEFIRAQSPEIRAGRGGRRMLRAAGGLRQVPAAGGWRDLLGVLVPSGVLTTEGSKDTRFGNWVPL